MTKFPGSHTPGGKVRPLHADEVRRSAFDRWPDILAALGIPVDVLAKKRNQPCPACGGRDRFQFIDKGQGRFVCRSMDSLGGDGFVLAMHWLNADFPTALRAVAGVLGLAGDPAGVAIQRTPTPPAAPAKRDNSTTLARLWSEAKPIRTGDPVARYLAGRGLDLATYPTALRHHPALPYWCEVDGKPLCLGSFPAMLAEVTAPDGRRVALHRLYLTPDGHKARLVHPTTGEPLDTKKLLTAHEGAMRGAAVRLYEPEAGALAVAEGIETALAVRLGSGLPVWACVSAWGLANAALPESVTDVWAFGDHDTSGTGQKAADALARRLIGEARQVRVVLPEQAGTDWLDVYQSRQEEAA
ncbi:toprim domain-containing protein [Neisseriaceae bacterium JH1-16]|nr:toprim domain-containing protein [Neisseriaceae bacterium JH1-16]